MTGFARKVYKEIYKRMNTVTERLLQFLNSSPTAFHAVENFRKLLKENGYSELMENRVWQIEKGGKYFCTRNGSSLIAFRIPEETPRSFMIAASHSDSPGLKIKPNPEIRHDGLVQLNVEGYGGLLCGPWFDRPLTAAGRVMIKESDGISSRLVYIDRDLLMIPSLAIHMDRKANEGHPINMQKEMCPLFAQDLKENRFTSFLASQLNIPEETILAYDLFAVPRTRGTFFGADQEFISCPRLDDLECGFADMEGFLTAGPGQSVPLFALFDNEEVGSRTRQGADGTLLSDVLLRIQECLSISENQMRAMLADSFMLSVDNAHAVHPSWGEKADVTNRPKMNGGVVLKHSAAQKYTTDAVSASIVKQLAEKAGIPIQEFANHSAIPGGSTLGNLSMSHVSLMTADIGLAQLAMHSPCETAGAKDPSYLADLARTFFASALETGEDGTIRIL